MDASRGEGLAGVVAGEEVVFDKVGVKVGGAEEGGLLEIGGDFAVGAVGDDLNVGVVPGDFLVEAYCAYELTAKSPHKS